MTSTVVLLSLDHTEYPSLHHLHGLHIRRAVVVWRHLLPYTSAVSQYYINDVIQATRTLLVKWLEDGCGEHTLYLEPLGRNEDSVGYRLAKENDKLYRQIRDPLSH